MRPVVLILATVTVALHGAGCRRNDPAGAPGLAIVDTALGEVTDHWEAPALTFDVAEDPATGRVWAVAEHTGDAVPRVWELFADAEPELRYELQPGASGPAPGGTGFFGYGKISWAGAHAISFDPVRRRGSFASPGSDEMALLDLDSGEQLWSVYSYDWGWPIGMSFDLEQGIGYGSTIGILYSVITSSGQVANSGICPGWASTPAVDHVGRRVFYIASGESLSSYDPVADACGRQLGHFCAGHALGCTISGLIVSSDGERLYVAAPSLEPPIPPWDGPPSFSIWDLTAGDLDDPDIQTEIPDGAGPHQFALSPDDSTLYVSMLRCDRIGVYDAITGEHRYDIRTDAETMGIDLSADGTRLFVTQVRSDSALSRGPYDYTLRERAGGCPPLKHREEWAGP